MIRVFCTLSASALMLILALSDCSVAQETDTPTTKQRSGQQQSKQGKQGRQRGSMQRQGGKRGQGRRGGGQRGVDKSLTIGEMAPDFTLKSLDGKSETQLSSFRTKKPVVLMFGSYS